MKLKKLAAIGSAMVITLTMSTSVFAANNKDTGWSFTVAPSATTHITKLREKTNSSGCYIYYQAGAAPYLTVDVLNSEGQSMCTKIGRINVAKKGRVSQYVYENGFRLCKLKLTGSASTTGGAGGMWSPDSVGSDPYINS